MKPPVIFLMGPTASGKTDMAMALCEHLPVDIISVDSAMVYRHMDIGTAKPTADELARAPHRLINLCDPAEPYSAADFCEDAQREINEITDAGRIPLLVGGTMMYFKALLQGLADMPAADTQLRQQIESEAEALGWPAMHQKLSAIDADYAAQLHPNHSQRIARALEVFQLSGKTMTELRQSSSQGHCLTDRFRVLQLGLVNADRTLLHQRIAERFQQMLEQGFVDEVKTLRTRSDLNPDLPSMRAVGYRQIWHYLDGLEGIGEQLSYEVMTERGVAATRQLAKRQLTWLRGWPELQQFSFGQEKFAKKVELILNFLSPRAIKSL